MPIGHGPATTRHPLRNVPRNTEATITNDVAVPSSNANRRSTMPASNGADPDDQTGSPAPRFAPRAGDHPREGEAQHERGSGLDESGDARVLVVVASADRDERHDDEGVQTGCDGNAVVHPDSLPVGRSGSAFGGEPAECSLEEQQRLAVADRRGRRRRRARRPDRARSGGHPCRTPARSKQSIHATARSRIGEPDGAACHVDVRRSGSSSVAALRELPAQVALLVAEHVDAEAADGRHRVPGRRTPIWGRNPTIGGSSDTDVNEPIVNP